MESIQFKLEVFEGPLDLLLYLISKHKLNIEDIEISRLLDQYLEYINEMKMADLEIASDFLEMAARLVYIKTVSLLPKHEEADELKKELQGELLELALIKQVAEKLRARDRMYSIFVREPVDLPIDYTYHHNHESEELLSAFLSVAGKKLRKLPPPQSTFEPIVSRRIVSVTSRIFYLLRRLYKEGQAKLSDFFVSADRSENVATFLAVLELVKSKRLELNEDNTVLIFKGKGDDKADE